MNVSLKDSLVAAGTVLSFAALFGALPWTRSSASPDFDRTHRVALAVRAYTEDNDRRFPPSHYDSSFVPGQDRPWPETVFPYEGDWNDYKSTWDTRITDDRLCNNLFGRPCEDQTELSAARGFGSSRGYNWQYLAPFGFCFTQYRSAPVTLDQVKDQSKTLLLVTSIWDRVNGLPVGGGNWVVDMPARYLQDGTDTLPPLGNGCSSRVFLGGWSPSTPDAWNVYGGAWNWEAWPSDPSYRNRRFVAAMTDGGAKALTLGQLSAGAEVKDAWQGFVLDRDAYIWDLE